MDFYYTHEGDGYPLADKLIRYRQIRGILSLYPEGLTAKEVAHKMWEIGLIPTDERNFSAPRLTELEEKGQVQVIGKKTCQWTKKRVRIYQLVEEQ